MPRSADPDPGGDASSSNGHDVNRRVGDHLRQLRKQKGLSLLDVEAASKKKFKASVLGAYERGERTISASRLAGLADLYRLPLQAMLPPDGRVAADGSPGVALDVERLEHARTPEGQAVARFVRLLQAQRREWSERVVRIRSDDIRALACAVDRTPTDLLRLLDELKVRAF
jgi:transcriptional regulator with XRE-family HTH domain